ncbi:MAG TPA: dienelactone hydrolase family protein [Anaeromyxobacteraceae bacterium]|nr:dienelactone hydrolase family protein [Anaeromyxobacteraceae bacterium]
MKPTTFVAAAALLALAARAEAAIKTEEIEYRQGDTTLQGTVARDDAVKGKRPGVLVVHEWWGHNEHARKQAVRLAKAGYVAFALDMYGKGKVADATHPKDAQAFSEEVTKDPELVAARFNAGLDVLKQQPDVDPEKIAVVGYCMGGTIALGMARAGADVDAVATFHAGLKPPAAPAEKGTIKVKKVLVQTGGADPFVPKEQVQALEKELKAAGVDVQVVTYPKAKHSFTNPDANKAEMPALAYDAQADKQSWERLTKFLKNVFKS